MNKCTSHIRQAQDCQRTDSTMWSKGIKTLNGALKTSRRKVRWGRRNLRNKPEDLSLVPKNTWKESWLHSCPQPNLSFFCAMFCGKPSNLNINYFHNLFHYILTTIILHIFILKLEHLKIFWKCTTEQR